MNHETFGLHEIGQIHINVTDVGRAAAFYRDTLGMRFLYEFPGNAFFDCDGVRLYLSAPERPDFDGRSTIYYRVPSIDDAVSALEARGAAFLDAPHVVHRDAESVLWMAFVQDPDGNNVVLMSEVPVGKEP